MIHVTIRAKDPAAAAARVRARIRAIDLTKLSRQTIRDLETLHGQYFDAEAGPAGAWKALAPATVAAKGFDDILWETGRLRSSLESRTGESIREVRKEGGKTSLRFGTKRPYAGVHQDGRKDGSIPARPFVGITEAEAKVIRDRLVAEVVRQLTANTPARAA